jgi:hypothetical protein
MAAVLALHWRDARRGSAQPRVGDARDRPSAGGGREAA